MLVLFVGEQEKPKEWPQGSNKELTSDVLALPNVDESMTLYKRLSPEMPQVSSPGISCWHLVNVK